MSKFFKEFIVLIIQLLDETHEYDLNNKIM